MKYLQGHKLMTGTQALIGYKNIFRGAIVKDWHGNNDSESRYTNSNKIIVHDSVSHYARLWRIRNE